MRCFYVLVHGTLEWPPEHLDDVEAFTPAGFTCERYVLASGFEEAAEKAFRHVRKCLEKQTGWLKQGVAKLTLEAQELKPAPIHKIFKRGSKVSDFYEGATAS
ncbi:MAG TPA: hypothetical protein VNJ05_01985 [Sphingomicrobium sp.]|nr:hypothetical protein [Sphingomicrobium sp.]